MTIKQVEVETKIPGGLLASPERLVLEFPLEESVTIKELIRLKVEEETRRLAAMETLDWHSGQAMLGREYRDIEAAGASSSAQPPPDLPVEVSKAQKAFSEGRFLILVDGRHHTRLDEQVVLTPQSRVKFIRLVPLTGG